MLWNARVTAAAQGQLDFVYALLDASCPTNEDATWYACQAGHFDILQVLHLYGAMAIAAAFATGNYEALQCLLKHGAPYYDPYEDIEDDIMAGIYIHLQDNVLCDYDERLQ